jgi:hypothetical protein
MDLLHNSIRQALVDMDYHKAADTVPVGRRNSVVQGIPEVVPDYTAAVTEAEPDTAEEQVCHIQDKQVHPSVFHYRTDYISYFFPPINSLTRISLKYAKNCTFQYIYYDKIT